MLHIEYYLLVTVCLQALAELQIFIVKVQISTAVGSLNLAKYLLSLCDGSMHVKTTIWGIFLFEGGTK